MPRHRFYIPPPLIGDGSAELPAEQAHHVRNVSRLRRGAGVEIFDGLGNAWTGTLDITGHEVRVSGMEPLSPDEAVMPPLVLAAALFKAARFEWMLEKATELGVDEFVPLETRFSDARLSESSVERRVERWGRIVTQACEQCGRNRLPVIHRPVCFPDWLKRHEYFGYLRLICWERSERPSLPAKISPGPTVVCIGPEGGWDAGEIQAARDSGYLVVSLGPYTLRAETAALAAVTLIRIGTGFTPASPTANSLTQPRA
jgi:16S rRNA (uracil1498-N3)-methyltransferase